MTLKYRRILYSSFIALFAVITPLVILYAVGYRYNFENNRVEKTGIIHIETEPEAARIYINDEFVKRTPAKFIKLLPGKYKVAVQKEGYHSWEKEVEVRSNLTSFYRDIILFKNSAPEIITEGNINIFSMSPDRKKIVYSKTVNGTEELRLRNIKNNNDFLIQSLSAQTYNTLEEVQWSPGRNKLLIKKVVGDFNQYIIVDTVSLEVREIFDLTRLSFDSLAWDAGDENKLYGIRRAVLHQINLLDNTVNSLYSANISDFYVANGQLYFITKIINDSFLNKAAINGTQVGEIETIKLPSPSNFRLQRGNTGYLVLLDQNTKDLFVLNNNVFGRQDVSESIVLQDKAKKITWSADFGKILLYTDFEISVFDLASREKTLVTRYGEIINSAVWHPENNYTVYQIASQAKAIEIYGQEKNDVLLADLPSISGIGIEDAGENLYFKKAGDEAPGIYKLVLE